jgi:hypothetical protein
MLRLALVALLATSACRISLDKDNGGDGPTDSGPLRCVDVTTNPVCVMAGTLQDVTLSWIEQNVFTPNCGSASCHAAPTAGGNPAGRIVLTSNSYTQLVNVDATFATGRKLVVPGSVPQSYLMVILRGISLDEADPSPAPEPSGGRYMPLGSPIICCQKLEAMKRWIMAGAMNN